MLLIFGEKLVQSFDNNIKALISLNKGIPATLFDIKLRSYLHTNIMSVVTAPIRSVDFPMTWGSINPPLQSYFPGFGPPTDARRWSEALTQASRGEQILLSKVLEAIRSPFDLHEADIEFKWIHKVAEYHMSKGTSNWRNDIWFYPRVHQDKAPIVMMGFHKFDRSGGMVLAKSFMLL